MKLLKKISLLLLIVMGVVACGTVHSVSGGKANEAYLRFVSNLIAGQKVDVCLNDDAPVAVKVLKDKRNKAHEKQLTIVPGKYKVRVVDQGGSVIYEGQIFVTNGNTRTIKL